LLQNDYNAANPAQNGSDLFTDNKNRVDKIIQRAALVDAIRILAIAVKAAKSSAYPRYTGGYVWFPQIQVFAGVPLLPKMTSSHSSPHGQDT